MKFNESLFRALLENLTDSIYFKDKDSKFLLCNETHARMLGAASVDDLIGKSDADYFGPLHAEKARKDELRVIREGLQIANILEQVDFPGGEIEWHLTSKAPLYNECRDIVGILGISKDITELKLTQDTLLEAQRKISEDSRNAGRAEIASIVIHNVGNMLNSVNVTASMIEKFSTQHEELELSKLADSIAGQMENSTMDSKEYLGKIHQYIQMAANRFDNGYEEFRTEIEHLKQDVSRIQRIILVQQSITNHLKSGQLRSCVDVINDAIEINRIALLRHEVVCKRKFEADTDWDIPEFQVLQILLNFISNSKYAFDEVDRECKWIELNTKETDTHLSISVTDNAIGMLRDQFEQIFELGFTTREDGHGLGLHGSQMAAKEINSKITVWSKGKGEGATFTLLIPLSECRKRNE